MATGAVRPAFRETAMNTLSGKPLHHRRFARHCLANCKARRGDGAISHRREVAVANTKLPGTTPVPPRVEAAGGRALALQCDIREEAGARRRRGHGGSVGA